MADFGKLIDEVTKDWQWLSFVSKYCAGRNIGRAFCEEFKWWVLGIAVLLALLVIGWIWRKLARAYQSWNQRRLMAEVAEPKTMRRHVWSGHDAHKTEK
jgi:hypothetical protein